MLVRQANSMNLYGNVLTKQKKFTLIGNLRQIELKIERRLELFLHHHPIASGIFVFIGVPILVLLGVTLSTTIFCLFYCGITAL